MRFVSPLGVAAGLAGLAAAEDFVFHEGFLGPEYQQVQLAAMGFSAVVKTDEEWRALTADDFKAFKAIAVGEQQCRDPEDLAWFRETKEAWGAAVLGNVAVMGTQHIFTQSDGWTALMDAALRFVANGTATGLYYTTSCSPDDEDTHTLDDLDVFGPIKYIANPRSNNPAHLVVQGAPWTDLSDDVLGNFDSNAGTLFTAFPPEFEGTVITTKVAGRPFGDRSNGLPFVLTRGAVPVGCGDGVWDPLVGEQCDPSADPEGICAFNCRCTSAANCPPPSNGESSSTSTVTPVTTIPIGDGASTSSGEYVSTSSGEYISTSTDDAVSTDVYTTYDPTYTPTYDPTLIVDPTGTLSTSIIYPTNDPVYPTYDPAYPTSRYDPQPTYPADVCGVEIIYVVEIIEFVRPGETGMCPSCSWCHPLGTPLRWLTCS